MTTHMVVIMFPPVYISQRNAVQWGAGAIKGDIRNPYGVLDVQKYVYKCGVIKCKTIHNP
jgi:hypothetical protein